MKVTLQPSGHVIELQPGERILDAARRLGFDAPQSCRNGNCHICAANLISGKASMSDQQIEQGELYTCLAQPLQDCEIHWEGVLAPDELPVHSLACQLDSIEDLGADVCRLRLRMPAGKAIKYHPGQYLLLQRDPEQLSAFSIASTPQQGRIIELHILTREPQTQALVDRIQRERLAHIRLPFGDCHLARLPERPLLLIAAGTGLAQMQSMLEHCRQQGFALPIHLYWGAREGSDFYQAPCWQQWHSMPNLQLHQVVSDDSGWQGRTGLLSDVVIADHAGRLDQYQIMVSGSPGMVYATLDALVAAGMPAANMHSDVFAYAPRD